MRISNLAARWVQQGLGFESEPFGLDDSVISAYTAAQHGSTTQNHSKMQIVNSVSSPGRSKSKQKMVEEINRDWRQRKGVRYLTNEEPSAILPTLLLPIRTDVSRTSKKTSPGL